MTNEQSARFNQINRWLEAHARDPVERKKRLCLDREFDFVMACLTGRLGFNFEEDTIARVIGAHRSDTLIDDCARAQSGAFYSCGIAYQAFATAWDNWNA